MAINKKEQDYKYKYNAKEYQDELGLDWYDYGARNYDASLGRWMNVDPLADVTLQPYSAFNNNPIYYNDPTGMIAEGGDHVDDIIVKDSKGNHLFTLDDGKEAITTKTVQQLYDEGVQWF